MTPDPSLLGGDKDAREVAAAYRKAVLSPRERDVAIARAGFNGLLVKIVVSLIVFLFLAAVFALLLSVPVARHLHSDALYLLLGVFGYVAAEILTAYSHWMRSRLGAEEADDADDSREGPEDYAPGMPPEKFFRAM